MGAENMAAQGISRFYLVIYNGVQAFGWFVILILGIKHLVENETHIGIYSSVEIPLKVFQTAAILEVIHCVLGLVPSSVMLTAFQVSSRIFVTWAIAHSIQPVQNLLGVPLFVFAWTTTEIVRYSFYLFTLLNRLPYVLQWCRYTFFFVLYPIGITGELLTIYAALPHVRKSGLYSVVMPNQANIAFSYYHFLIFVMLSYIPLF